jgi:hypothetical protein
VAPTTSWGTSTLKTQAPHNDVRAWIRGLLPVTAAALAFALAFALGMTTKSSPTPQMATSLAPPVAIQAPRAAVPALDRVVPTPGLKARPKPAAHPKSSPAPGSASSVTSASSPSTGVTQTPLPPSVVNSPPSGVVHGSGGGGSTSSGGGSGVVHGGN